MIRTLTWFVNRSPSRLSTSVDARDIAWSVTTIAISIATSVHKCCQSGPCCRALTTASMISFATHMVASGVAALATRKIIIQRVSGQLVSQINPTNLGTYLSADIRSRSLGGCLPAVALPLVATGGGGVSDAPRAQSASRQMRRALQKPWESRAPQPESNGDVPSG